jgi:RNA polymerase sigma factor (sigma-70 family)
MEFGEGDGELYRKHADELTRYATMLVGPQDAADLVASTILAAMSSRGWPLVENPRAYLYRAVANAAARSLRRNVLRRAAEGRAVAGPRWPDADPRPEVVAALRSLSVRQRSVVYLTYWEDLTPAACAELLDVSEGTVRKALARARERLRGVLDEP